MDAVRYLKESERRCDSLLSKGIAQSSKAKSGKGIAQRSKEVQGHSREGST